LFKFEAREKFNTAVPMAIGMRMLNFLITKKLGKELPLFIFYYHFATVFIYICQKRFFLSFD